MRFSRCAGAAGTTAVLATAMILASASGRVHAAQAEERSRRDSERQPCCQPAVGNWRDFVQLEVRDKELVLTNVSDRPIVAWIVRQVTRIAEGNEGYLYLSNDAFGHSLIPDGYERLLDPGESVTLERPGDPWIRPDLKGPEYLVYYDVGALVFESAEWVGVPRDIDRIFERRLEVAWDALTALDVIGSGGEELDRLPRTYQLRLEQFASRSDGLGALLAEARESYENAIANLRPEDVAKLPRLEEAIP